MPDYSTALNNVFHALADPTRRAVVQRLSLGTATVSELSEPFDMALQSFIQHMKVLEDCGLVRSQKEGRVRTCQIVPERLNNLEQWTSQLRSSWENRLDNLDLFLKQQKDNTE